MANFGVTQFSVAAFQGMYDFPRATAVVALTAYQVATLLLILPGGLLARTSVMMIPMPPMIIIASRLSHILAGAAL